MSSLIQEIERAITALEASCTNIIRRVSLVVQNIATDLSKTMNQGIQCFKFGKRQNTQCTYPPASSTSQLHVPQQPQTASFHDDHSAFLACFEQQYGSTTHPFFYTCSFEDGMKLARDEFKFMFMYLHSPRHPYVHSFCKETLCCEVVVQFLDANFVSWGGVVEWGEGMYMSSTLRPNSYPFCALIAPSPDNSISVLQQIEGPVSADELVEILQRTLEEQGSAFGQPRHENAGKNKTSTELRETHDASLRENVKMLKSSQDKDHVSSSSSTTLPIEASTKSTDDNDIPVESLTKYNQNSTTVSEVAIDATASAKETEITKILIRFPDGEKRETSFKITDKIEQLYWFIDSLALPGIGNYQFVSGLPRRVYGVEEMGMRFKDAGLHPRASLFLELM